MIPTLQVVKIQPAQFIANSQVGVGEEYSGGTVLSRQGRFSDDDAEWFEE